MDFRMELAKWGYNKGNSIDVEILIEEILPSLFPQQQGYSEEEVIKLLIFCKDRFGDSELYHYSHDDEVKKWFEQVKKK